MHLCHLNNPRFIIGSGILGLTPQSKEADNNPIHCPRCGVCWPLLRREIFLPILNHGFLMHVYYSQIQEEKRRTEQQSRINDLMTHQQWMTLHLWYVRDYANKSNQIKSIFIQVKLLVTILSLCHMGHSMSWYPRVVSNIFTYSYSDFLDHKPLGVCSDKPNKPTHVYT